MHLLRKILVGLLDRVHSALAEEPRTEWISELVKEESKSKTHKQRTRQ